jgi:putative transposase
MHFEPGGIYHIYNQGNNKQPIFFTRENYLFFLRKISTHILPYGELLAYCLMPNHFHLMVEVQVVELPGHTHGVTAPHMPGSHPVNMQAKPITLNSSIGIMLRSYTRAINIQEHRTGALFREETKSICLNELHGFTSNWYSSYGVTFLNVYIPQWQYAQVCFNYIHNNPVKAGLVKNPEDWEFSSYPGLKGQQTDSLVNSKRVEELGLSIL